jgi:hypothetical protein
MRHDGGKGPSVSPPIDQMGELRQPTVFPQRLHHRARRAGGVVVEERNQRLDMSGIRARAIERLVLEPEIDLAQIVQRRECRQPRSVLWRKRVFSKQPGQASGDDGLFEQRRQDRRDIGAVADQR